VIQLLPMQLEFSLAEINIIAKKLLDNPHSKVWLFTGEMGVGKTTLIKALTKQLGIKDNSSSPTFSLVNEYTSSDGPVYHFDLYRLKTEKEAFDFGIEEYLFSGNYCFIEWPDKIPNLLPESYVNIEIRVLESGKRILNFILY